LIELYFVTNDQDNHSKILIKNSIGLENNENKQIAINSLLKTTQDIQEKKKIERDSIYPKNSFLDGNY
jgi:hypothetical protein